MNQEKQKLTAQSYAPLLNKLVDKYHGQFDLSKAEFRSYLMAILQNETENQVERFLPPNRDPDEPYFQTGDNNNAAHAWQIDKRSTANHRAQFRPMSFNESGEFAISKVLLPGYRMAKKEGLKNPHIAAAQYYNAGNPGLKGDENTTRFYGSRVAKNWNKFKPDQYAREYHMGLEPYDPKKHTLDVRNMVPSNDQQPQPPAQEIKQSPYAPVSNSLELLNGYTPPTNHIYVEPEVKQQPTNLPLPNTSLPLPKSPPNPPRKSPYSKG